VVWCERDPRSRPSFHARRSPLLLPWTLDEANDACFIVSDKNGQALAYVYFEDDMTEPADSAAR